MLSENTINNIKDLIKVCKQTENYTTLAETAYTLIYNKATEIGIRLGFTPLEKSNKKFQQTQVIFPYLNRIQRAYTDNFNILIFTPQLLRDLNRLETIYHKTRRVGKFALTHIKEMFSLLFELDNIELPNLYKQISEENIDNLGNIKLFSSLFGNGKTRGQKQSKSKSKSFTSELMKFNFHQKEKKLENQLRQQYDPDTVEQLLLLKKIKHSLEDSSDGKIKIKGTLAESISFRNSFTSLYEYFILGLTITFFGLGIVIIASGLFSPTIFAALSMLLLLFFGAGAFFLFIYWNYFMRNKDR